MSAQTAIVIDWRWAASIIASGILFFGGQIYNEGAYRARSADTDAAQDRDISDLKSDRRGERDAREQALQRIARMEALLQQILANQERQGPR